MPFPSVHERITETVLKEQGFSSEAIEIAMAANAQVDEKQGKNAAETNLHAMRGYVGNRLQSIGEARQAVAHLLTNAEGDIVAAITSDKHAEALRMLGAALHTVQDRAVHQFEPWPYSSIGRAIATDPGYMLMHGVRDLCWTPYLLLGSARSGKDVAAEVGVSTYFSFSWFPDSIGLRGNYGLGEGRPSQVEGLLTLCWGCRPGNRSSPSSGSVQPGPLGTDKTRETLQPNWASEHRLRTVLQEAEDGSRGFLDSVKKASGSAWDDFTRR